MYRSHGTCRVGRFRLARNSPKHLWHSLIALRAAKQTRINLWPCKQPLTGIMLCRILRVPFGEAWILLGVLATVIHACYERPGLVEPVLA